MQKKPLSIRIKDHLVAALPYILIFYVGILANVYAYSRLPELTFAKKAPAVKIVNSTSPYIRKHYEYTTPTVIPSATPSPVQQTTTHVTADSSDPWGIAKQIGEHTWTMKVGDDERMGTPQEILEALNVYRQRYGQGTLTWDTKLAEYAQSRADYFTQLGKTDVHDGFNKYLDDNGFEKLGFNSLGENSSYGYKLLGIHIIEWIYAADKPHNDNQLSSGWSHIGIGVNEVATDLIFGGEKR